MNRVKQEISYLFNDVNTKFWNIWHIYVTKRINKPVMAQREIDALLDGIRSTPEKIFIREFLLLKQQQVAQAARRRYPVGFRVAEFFGRRGTAYVNDEDIADIMSWTDDDAARVAAVLSSPQSSFSSGFSISSCPWCVLTAVGCQNCAYGKRHGICGNGDSDLQMLNAILGKNNHFKIINEEFYKRAIAEALRRSRYDSE